MKKTMTKTELKVLAEKLNKNKKILVVTFSDYPYDYYIMMGDLMVSRGGAMTLDTYESDLTHVDGDLDEWDIDTVYSMGCWDGFEMKDKSKLNKIWSREQN